VNAPGEPATTGALGLRPCSRWRHWTPWLWTAVIVIVSVVPAEWLLGAAPERSWSVLASLAHAFEFAILAGLIVWREGAAQTKAWPSAVVLLRAGATALLLALLIEVVQWPLPYRSFDGRDLAADAAGIVLGLGLSAVALRRAACRSGR